MASRSGIPGTKSGGTDSISVPEFNDLGGALIGYKVVTSNQTGITSPVDLTNLTEAVTPTASRILRIDYSFTVLGTNASEEFQVLVLKDGTQISRLNFAASGASFNGGAFGSVLDIGPTAFSHTYKLQLGRSGSSSGSFSLQASATAPATLFISDVGPSF